MKALLSSKLMRIQKFETPEGSFDFHGSGIAQEIRRSLLSSLKSSSDKIAGFNQLRDIIAFVGALEI